MKVQPVGSLRECRRLDRYVNEGKVDGDSRGSGFVIPRVTKCSVLVVPVVFCGGCCKNWVEVVRKNGWR